MLLLVGGPPARRPERDRGAGYVAWEGLSNQEILTWRTWASKVQEIMLEQNWDTMASNCLFLWITGFLDWFDSMSIQAEGRERYHRAGHRHG